MNPPCNTFYDRAKFREQYLSNLILQASNDQKNLTANTIFKQTGETPSQLLDTRTLTEKYADVLGLRHELRGFLFSTGICDFSNSNEVVQELSNEELVFFKQYQDFIGGDFKGRGIPAVVFVAYLKRLLEKTNITFGVEYGLQQTSGNDVLISPQQIINDMPNTEQLTRLENAVKEVLERFGGMETHINNLPRHEHLSHSIQEIKDRLAELRREEHTAPYEDRPDIQREMRELNENMISLRDEQVKMAELHEGMESRLTPLINNLTPLINNKPNVTLITGQTTRILDQIKNLKDTIPTEEKIREINSLNAAQRATEFQKLNMMLGDVPTKNDIAQLTNSIETIYNPTSAIQALTVCIDTLGENIGVIRSGTEILVDTERERKLAALEERKYSAYEERKPSAYAITEGHDEPETIYIKTKIKKEKTPSQEHIAKESPLDKELDELELKLKTPGLKGIGTIMSLEKFKEKPKEFKLLYIFNVKGRENFKKYMEQHDITTLDKFSEGRLDYLYENWSEGHRLSGSGLTKGALAPSYSPDHKRNCRKTPLQRSTGYDKPKPFVQFGRYLINRHKLDDNILMVKRPSGCPIVELPTSMISERISQIVKNMCGGHLPDYNELNGLKDTEKTILHNLVKVSRFPFVVPNPKKNDEEKEINRFDILKGEILAGNDNKMLVKEFKLLVMKFLEDGRLPRREAHSILTDLTALGF